MRTPAGKSCEISLKFQGIRDSFLPRGNFREKSAEVGERVLFFFRVENSTWSTEDIVRSLLFMISNNISQIAYLNAKLHNVQRIYFSGGIFIENSSTFRGDFAEISGFLQQNPYVWGRLSYGVDFWSSGTMKAHFLQHNSYLGAIGALVQR